MKKKVKICMNVQCADRVNKPNAAVCACCGSSFRGINVQFLDENEIEEVLHPTKKPEEGFTESPQESSEPQSVTVQEVVICPECGRRTLYRVGLTECECGAWIQDEIPVREMPQTPEATDKACSQSCTPACVSALSSLDGKCRLELTQTWMKIGRQAAGQAYFQAEGKRKVSREHAIIQRQEDGWYISYCKKEDRNYQGGVENPIFINNRRLERQENYKLQSGDEIAFTETDKSDRMAAFFRVE